MNTRAYAVFTALILLIPCMIAHGQDASQPAKTLLELAQEKFADLTLAEQLMFIRTENGEPAICAVQSDDTNPATADDWGTTRVIRADRIAWLCTDPQAVKLVTHRGIYVEAIRIEGKLDLKFALIPFPLTFKRCMFKSTINLMYAHMRGLYLNGSYTKSISADGLSVEGNVFLRDGFTANGEVRLPHASIGNNLNCDNATLNNPTSICLNAVDVKVEGNIFLNDGFNANGEVCLAGASIGGNLDSENGVFSNLGGIALYADGVKVEGSVNLRNGFNALGEVRLPTAIIGGNLDCSNAIYSNPDGKSIVADSMEVEGCVLVRNDFKASGEVRLVGASIGQNLECDNSTFSNPAGFALNADGVKVEGNVFLRDGIKAHGFVVFAGAEVNKDFQARGFKSPANVLLDLRYAKIGMLYDDEQSWPEKGYLFLHGLVYNEICHEAPQDVQTRIRWLRRQPSENPSAQPYEQLAKFYGELGRDEDAKQVLIAKNKDPDLLLHKQGWALAWHKFLGWTIQYGYNPWRPFWFSILWIFVFTGIFWCASKHKMMMPKEQNCRPKVNWLIYSVDTFFPVINLNQGDYWSPQPKEGSQPSTSHYILQALFWLHILVGWTTTSLWLVGLTGLMRT